MLGATLLALTNHALKRRGLLIELLVGYVHSELRINFDSAYQRFPVDLFVDRFVDFLFACARSDPATLLTVALLLFLRSLAALLASLFDVAMAINLLLLDRTKLISKERAALCRAACDTTQLRGNSSIR